MPCLCCCLHILDDCAALTLLLAELRARLFPVHGYTDHDVTNDPRFRLITALREQGLHTTAAGREAIQYVSDFICMVPSSPHVAVAYSLAGCMACSEILEAAGSVVKTRCRMISLAQMDHELNETAINPRTVERNIILLETEAKTSNTMRYSIFSKTPPNEKKGRKHYPTDNCLHTQKMSERRCGCLVMRPLMIDRPCWPHSTWQTWDDLAWFAWMWEL